jgi:hypothetical protein
MGDNIVFIEKFRLAFIRGDDGYYIPYRYDCKRDINGRLFGKKISFDSEEMLGLAMFMFVYFVQSTGMEIDKNTGNRKQGYAEIYQYCIAFRVIRALLRLESDDIICAIARQSKQMLDCINSLNSVQKQRCIMSKGS